MERVMTTTSHGSDQTMQNEKDLFFNIIKTNRLYVHALPNSLATTAFGCIIQLQNRELAGIPSLQCRCLDGHGIDHYKLALIPSGNPARLRAPSRAPNCRSALELARPANRTASLTPQKEKIRIYFLFSNYLSARIKTLVDCRALCRCRKETR